MHRFIDNVLRVIGRRQKEPDALVLLYHRVVDMQFDPHLLCVAPKNFAQQLEVIRQSTNPMRLTDLVQARRTGAPVRRAVVITFDDGYIDNLHHAQPLLAQHELPATLFIATGYVGHPHEFWWDALEHMLLHPGTLQNHLSLTIRNRTYNWELGDAADYRNDQHQRYLNWNIEQEYDPTLRHQIFRAIYELIHPLQAAERSKVLYALGQWSGNQPTVRPSHRTMAPAEILQLADAPLIEIGAHTVTHPMLSELPADAQLSEIQQSKSNLEGLIGRSVTSFSYPHGAYSAVTNAIVRNAGFECACTSDVSGVRQDTNLFQLPRLVIGNWDAETFGKQLEQWFQS
jgi:peptidoglycan/xylan/chitin deacetylase (PgdA/CDA1 family)